MLAGVPMPWMTEWAGPYPVFVAEAEGARFTDVDGRTYVDFCLGDTGAMTGHGPKVVVDVIAERAILVVVLTVHVARDRAADGHLPGPGADLREEPERPELPH